MIALPQDPDLVLIARYLLAGIFLLGAIHKLGNLAQFSGVVRNYQILPDAVATPFAYALPAIELLAAITLVGGLVPAGNLVAILLIGLVTGGVVINIRRGRTDIDCGCGGGAEQPLSLTLVLRNLVLIALACYAALPFAERPYELADLAVIGFGTLAGLGLYIAVNQAAANWSRMNAHTHGH